MKGATPQQQRKYGFWGYLSFAWMLQPVMAAWSKQELVLDNFYFPDPDHADVNYDRFQAEWQASQKANGNKKGQLLAVLRKLYGRKYMLAGLCKLAWGGFVITGAFFFVRSLLRHVNPKETGHPFMEPYTGWVLACGFFLAAVIWGLCLQRMNFLCMDQGVKVRAALVTAVTRKAIFMDTVSVEQACDIVGFVANDINKVYDGMLEFHYLWTAPIEAIVILSLLASLVKWWAAPAVGIVAIVMFSQYYFGYRIAMNKFKMMGYVNRRGGILQEVLPAMKLVKYYGWEKFFEDKITAFRKLESKLQMDNIWFKVLNITLVFTVPPAAAFAIFSSYEFESARLQTTLAFTTLSLFNILRFPLVVLPKALRAASEAAAALSNIEEYLQTANEEAPKKLQKSAEGVSVDRAVFQYPGHDGHAFKLTVPDFHVAPGEVVAVVGRVGAGKSALLDALLGNMHCVSGNVQVGGKVAYVPQVAWVQNMTIKENILFGLPFDEHKYNDVLHACALEQDLLMLPQGDQSSCGIRGINLSGGQRQRVNIARAAYFNADTILLDNALSAVDHHTADHIFTELVQGTFRNKAVVLVTHQLQFVRRCHKVAIIDGGEFKYFGPFTPAAQAILAQYLPIPNDDTANVEHVDQRPKAQKAKVATAPVDAKPVTQLPMGKSTWKFLNAGNFWNFIICIAFAIIAQSSRQMSDFWVRYWSGDKYGWYAFPEEYGGEASHKYAWTYGALTFAFFAFQYVRNFMLYWWAKKAADRMHKMKLHRVLNTPLTFFLVKPVGELLSTFSSDQDKTDENLPDVLLLAITYFFILLSTSVTVSITINEFAAFTGVLGIVTIVMLRVYLPAATMIKNMRLTTAGKVVGLTAEVLEGLPVVQAYSHEEYFVHEFTKLTDRNHRALFNAESLNLWVAFYCDFYGAIMIFAVCLFAVAEKSRGAPVIGLAFSNCIQLLVFYTWTLRLVTEAISLSASVEQLTWLSYYTPIDGKDDVNNEGKPLITALKWKDLKQLNEEKEQQKDLAGWPRNGAITFENVKMRYRPTAGLALAGVNLEIRHGERVGIVGRTGSGKSTLLLALYRAFNLAEGRITVGGVDISTLPLQQQRRGLSIVPQEPTMWTGTLRENLDPFHQHNDMEMYELLEKVGLRDQTMSIGGLDGHVDGSGSDRWSLGQMQLVCLVRAALNKVPVVCFDEATAALDPHTEKQVLEAAEKLFADRTTITIAHRLDAVIDVDTIVVMEAGKVVEKGRPVDLLNNPASWFSKLVDMSGPAEAAHLRSVAAQHFARHRGF